MPGPPPNKHARRRNARPDWRRLPRSGREGDAPEWPLSKATRAEAELWRQLWASPQAVAWEALGWARSVARYCRAAVQAEKRGALAFLLSEVRQMEDRLGLNPKAMKSLAWEIDDEPRAEEHRDDNVADLAEYRERFG